MSNMIVWLNGTYGVGKTSVAIELQKQLRKEKTMIFESDELFQSMDEVDFYKMIIMDGGTNPQNNTLFLNQVIEKLKKHLNAEGLCIVPMALTSIKAKEIVWDFVIKHCSRFFSFILEAEEAIICERIKDDSKRIDKSFALQEMDTNIRFLNKHFQDAIRIDTSNKMVADVAKEIIQYIEL